MNIVRFRLNLSQEQILAYYQGAANKVSVRAEDGRIIKFPAQWLRPHVSADGVRGRFQLRFTEENRLIDLRRIGD